MPFKPMNSQPQCSIFKLSAILFLTLAFAACKKDPAPVDPGTPPVDIEKKILDFYIPFKNIVIDEAKHQIVIYETKDFDDFESLTPEIEVSDNVTIQPASGVTVDATKPVTYTLTATDGSKVTYDLIICNVEWQYMETMSGGFMTTGMAFFEEPWSAVSQNGILTLHFGWDDESSIDIYLKSTVSAALEQQFSVGNYTTATLPDGKACATFVYRENGVVKTFSNPNTTGTLTISDYDAAKSTITGSFSQIRYTGTGNSTQGSTIVSGTFEQLPVEMK